MNAKKPELAKSILTNSTPRFRFTTSAKTSVRSETLLIVDDEQWVELEAEILAQEGYRVLQAESAEKALRLAGEAPTIHLLITDFSMPDVDGLELTRLFREVHPKTPVLMVSGSLAFLRDGARDLCGLEVLGKPFHISELLHKVRTLLDTHLFARVRKPWCHD